ncbi:efflux RND transporter periplasmic adaptor subunit [uncultured Psychroserpens sp.]|uniref:efflux RND transporter periplasmic adaptor subunit n=1 Tax=uncultured Psychroserpens sp. TaxID=255436 RepID=UPI00262A9F77|nr:efflux RND transporter periplasmic adaptor subunit [uncultured Psychroserpens sp.]
MKRHTYKIYTAFLFILLFGCANTEKTSGDTIKEITDDRIKVSKAQFTQNNMVLGTIEEKDFPVTVSVNGMIDVPPENRAVVNSTMGGYIKTTPFLEGDSVKKGQVLVSIENPEFVTIQQEYMEVKEQLNYLKSEFDRQNIMLEEQITSQKSFLKAESGYKTAKARYNGLRKQLTMLNISPTNVENGIITSVINLYAPISGSITEVNVTKGTYVSPATSIMEIIDNAHIHIELSVFEKDIMKIKKGQKISFQIPEASNDTFEAEVHLVGTSIGANRTIKVHGHPLDSEHSFLTGMFVNAQIITDEKKAIVLPETAVVEVDGDYFVLVLDETDETNYYFNTKKIKVGHTANGFMELKDNIFQKTSDQLLLNGAFGLIGTE